MTTTSNTVMAEHLRDIADRVERGDLTGVFCVTLADAKAKWSHYTLPSQALTMLGATQSCQLALVERLTDRQERKIGEGL